MPIQPGWVKIVLHGHLPQGEIWETGFWMINTGVASQAAADALCNIIWGTCTANDASGSMTKTLADLFNDLMDFYQVRAYVYTDTSGHATYIGEYTHTPAFPGSTSVHNPLQIAACLTLRTGFAGRSYRGRMYLPAAGMQLGADGQIPLVTLTDVATAWATFFTDVNASDTGKIVVASATRNAAHQVTAVDMDSRADVQRRRANHQSILRAVTQPVTI